MYQDILVKNLKIDKTQCEMRVSFSPRQYSCLNVTGNSDLILENNQYSI